MKEFNLSKFRNTRIPSEAEIMSTWQGEITKPVVSVVCLTFNQETYIEDAIRGFLIQKTSIPFEIIIHDDASTDTTNRIITKYQNKYKNIIKPIVQLENQYSKSPNSVILIAAKKAAGDYIALCEGDDFWIDPEKLQKQFEFLKTNKKYKICLHPGFAGCTEDSNKFKLPFKNLIIYPLKASTLQTKEIIFGGGAFYPTASMFFSRDILELIPDWFLKCPVGDYFLQLIASNPHGAIFIPDPMSFYRISSIGSWNANIKSDHEKKIKFHKEMTKSLSDLDKHFNGEYHFEIKEANSRRILSALTDTNISTKEKSELLKNLTSEKLVTFFLGFTSCESRSNLMHRLISSYIRNVLRAKRYFYYVYRSFSRNPF